MRHKNKENTVFFFLKSDSRTSMAKRLTWTLHPWYSTTAISIWRPNRIFSETAYGTNRLYKDPH